MSKNAPSDIIIIGAGIVGLATAWQLSQRRSDLKIRVLEKESGPAHHQTGHNSGVIHSGIYYKPGSLKAKNCRAGKAALEKFCQEENVPFETCGKVIVAVDENEIPALERIHERGKANGVQCERISVERLAELEPHAAGVAALHVPETGIVNFTTVCEKLVEKLNARDECDLHFGAKVTNIKAREGKRIISTTQGDFETKYIVNCAGLHSDNVARMTKEPGVRIVPFRGEYFELKPEAHKLCRNLIYPVPDPAFPFLGVHLTRMIDGGIECGPNAVLAFGREGYGKLDLNLPELASTLTYGGFIKLAMKHWRMGAGEMWRSFSKAAFVRALQRLVPDISADVLHPVPAGIRAQAVDPSGKTVDDFIIEEDPGVVNVLNAPSPAATSSLTIGEHIAEVMIKQMG